MRKVNFQMLVSLDGFFEGPQHEIDWHTVDDEYNRYAWDICSHSDTLLFGRITYELMAAYWPSAQALKEDPITAGWMNRLDKVVFSHTLTSVDWQNTRLVTTDPVAEVARLKALPGKDITIFGSSDLSLSLIDANLIDEYILMINPVILGKGKRLFVGLDHRLELKLVGSKVFSSGLVGLFYQPVTHNKYQK
jgi:dihydrofolate reductase